MGEAMISSAACMARRCPAVLSRSSAFHASAPVLLPRDSEFVQARRAYKEELHRSRKAFMDEISLKKSLQSQQEEEALKVLREEKAARQAARAVKAAENRAASLAAQAEMKMEKMKEKRKSRKKLKQHEAKLARLRAVAL